MNYYPQMAYQPYQQQQPTQSNFQQLIKVNGVEGARAYQMTPNSSVALFDTNEDLIYIKSTDGAGFPTIDTYRFNRVEEKPVPEVEYVSKEEMMEEIEKLRKEIKNGKQYTSKPKKPTINE